MIFTDQELAALKWGLENPAPNWLDKDNLRGLIHRLEAAETGYPDFHKILFDLKDAFFAGGNRNLRDYIEWETVQRAIVAEQTWRKAAGK